MKSLLALTSISCLLATTVLAETPAAPAIPTPTAAPASAKDPNAPVTRAEIPALVKEALLNDPGIILEAAQKYQAKQMAETQKEIKANIEKNRDVLFKDTQSPSIGDVKTADITIIEFFDYHCGYCKKMLPTINQLVKEDKKVHVIFREFPILSEDSAKAARAALAVNIMDKSKYFDFHTALMQASSKYDDDTLMALAKKQGINTQKLKTTMESREVANMLEDTKKLASDLGVRGTPALVVGDQVYPGAISYENLKKTISDIRSGKTPTDPLAEPAS